MSGSDSLLVMPACVQSRSLISALKKWRAQKNPDDFRQPGFCFHCAIALRNNFNVRRLGTFLALRDIELHFLAFKKRLET